MTSLIVCLDRACAALRPGLPVPELLEAAATQARALTDAPRALAVQLAGERIVMGVLAQPGSVARMGASALAESSDGIEPALTGRDARRVGLLRPTGKEFTAEDAAALATIARTASLALHA